MRNLLVILAFLGCSLMVNTTKAASQNPTSNIAKITTQEAAGVFVHITAVRVKKTKKGPLLEIKAIKVGKRNASLQKNQFSGKLFLKDNKVGIRVLSGDKVIAGVRMPKGFKIPTSVTQKLGTTQSVVMSGGSTMLQPQSDSLLWFEIQ